MPPRYEVIGIEGIGEVRPGDDVARIVVEAAARQGTPLAAADVLVLSQKIVSKSEGRLLRLSEVTPSLIAETFAAELGRDPRLIEVILRESRRIVRMDRGVLVTETHHGWVCANAGVDQSNVDADMVALLPEDSDRSARGIRETLRTLIGGDVDVIIADTFGRPWREGLINVAIGVAGFAPLRSYLGELDPAGRPLQATILAVADELAGAAEPVMGKLDRIPVAIVRGLPLAPSEEGSKACCAIRPATSSDEETTVREHRDPRRYGQGGRRPGHALGPGRARDHHRLARRRARAQPRPPSCARLSKTRRSPARATRRPRGAARSW